MDAAIPAEELDPIKETILKVEGVKVRVNFFATVVRSRGTHSTTSYTLNKALVQSRR